MKHKTRKKPTYITQAVYDKIKAATAVGFKNSIIGKHFDVTYSTVYRVIHSDTFDAFKQKERDKWKEHRQKKPVIDSPFSLDAVMNILKTLTERVEKLEAINQSENDAKTPLFFNKSHQSKYHGYLPNCHLPSLRSSLMIF
jgi:hypothetical protein